MQKALIATAIAAAIILPATNVSASSVRQFKNCTAMHKAYKHGVGQLHAEDHVSGHSKPVTNFKKSNALYAANKKLDRDKDHIACEAR